jgi:glycosyltransferase involved in cell wall biosynthesis
MHQIVFIQSRLPSDSRALEDLAARWDVYAEIVRKEFKGPGIAIFTPRRLGEIESKSILSKDIFEPNLMQDRFFVLSRILALKQYIRTTGGTFTLVCGDNQLSLLVALFLRLRTRQRVRIQIQFHGNTYSFFANRGLKGFFRVIMSRIGIMKADSIRIVSGFQLEEILKISNVNSSKFVIAPIPVDMSRVASKVSTKSVDLVFIGRLHQERGVLELIEIIEKLKVKRPEVTVVIAGEGPLRTEIELKLENWIRSGSVRVLGFVSGNAVSNILGSSKILISPARLEGYGLTIREAILSNVHVIARESRGTQDAKSAFPGQIETYVEVTNAINLIVKRLGNLGSRIDSGNLQRQARDDSQSLLRLIKSWL